MRLCDKIKLYTILYDIIPRDIIYLLLYYLRTKLTIYIILNIVYLYNLKATVNLKELVNFSFSSPKLDPLCAMRAQLLIKQLTIIINSIWLREHKEVAQVQKIYTYLYLWPDLPEWKVRCNGPQAKNSLGFSSKCKCNAIGQPAWFAHRIVSAPLAASGHWPGPSQ